MSYTLLSGTTLAQEIIKKKCTPRVQILLEKKIIPKLVVIWVGDNKASESYIKQKTIFAKECGIICEVKQFSNDVTEKEILEYIDELNNDSKVHGIIVQLPIPKHISVSKIWNKINPKKDVDGFSSENLGKLFHNENTALQSCTPKGILSLLDFYNIQIEGKEVVIISRSNIIGKPIAGLFINKGATVTVCHSKTKNIKSHTLRAEILIVATGKRHFLSADMVSEGVTIIDVGIHKFEGKIQGDVDFDEVAKKTTAITPVPGGVGPMTVISLLENTIQSAESLN